MSNPISSIYRGRLAPSPTGLLHVGHARTFWTAYERARTAAGVLVMRMEDLDPQRSREEYAQAALEDLHWLGIRWSEGPDLGGPFAPYRQSERYGLYVEAWRLLAELGWIYPCHCTRKDMVRSATAPHELPNPHQQNDEDEPLYPGTCRPAMPTPIAAPAPGGMNWRFRVPMGEAIRFHDNHSGPHTYVAGHDFGDFLVWRRDDLPSYQLACVVDDAAMRITEVVRGTDLLKSTARQILLQRALGYWHPEWYHCNLIADQHGRRLAKRADAVSLRTLRANGLTPLRIFSADLPLI